LPPASAVVNGRGDGICVLIRPVATGPLSRPAAVPRDGASSTAVAAAAAPGDRVGRSADGPAAPAWAIPLRFHPPAGGIALRTSPQAAARIAAGLHQRRVVDGAALAYPSQDLRAIESSDPQRHGQTHGLTEHVGKSLADNIRRLEDEPHLRAAGSYADESAAQLATDRTIANPANQREIAHFLADPERLKIALQRVDAGTAIGTTTTRADLDGGRPALKPDRTATVVLIKDPTFPEGYRVLTTYPDTRPAEVDARGVHQ
jgi:hypothetical protein